MRAALLFVALSSGCLSVPKPVASHGAALPAEEGRRTCSALAESARGARDASIGLGATSLALGVGGSVLAAAMGPDRSVDAWWIARNRNVVTLTAAVGLAAAGAGLVARAVELANVASEAQGLAAAAGAGSKGVDDADAYRGCLELGGGARRSGPREVAELRTELRKNENAGASRSESPDPRRVEAELVAKQLLVSMLEERLGRLALEREVLARATELATKPEPLPPPPPPKPGRPAPPPPPPPAAPPPPPDKVKELARVVAEIDLTTRQLASARAELELARRAFGGRGDVSPSRWEVPSTPPAPKGRRIPDDLGY